MFSVLVGSLGSVIKALDSVDQTVLWHPWQSRGAGCGIAVVGGRGNVARICGRTRAGSGANVKRRVILPPGVLRHTPRDISYMHIYVHYRVAGVLGNWLESVLLLGCWRSICSGFDPQK